MVEKIAGTLIAGLGDPSRGDEAVGIQIAKALRRMELPEGIEIFEGSGSYDMEGLIAHRRHVIIIDSVRGVGEAGSILELSPEDLLSDENAGVPLHTDLRRPLAVTYLLGCAPERVRIFGVIGTLDNGQELSEAVKGQIPAVIEAVLKEVRDNHF